MLHQSYLTGARVAEANRCSAALNTFFQVSQRPFVELGVRKSFIAGKAAAPYSFGHNDLTCTGLSYLSERLL